MSNQQKGGTTQEIASFFMAKSIKWVEDRPGKYRLVDIDDPRPEVKLKGRIGAPNIAYVPPWKKFETPMFIGDPHEQLKAASRFDEERQLIINKDKKAARWEKSRREWFATQKHDWRKKELNRLREQGL